MPGFCLVVEFPRWVGGSATIRATLPSFKMQYTDIQTASFVSLSFKSLSPSHKSVQIASASPTVLTKVTPHNFFSSSTQISYHPFCNLRLNCSIYVLKRPTACQPGRYIPRLAATTPKIPMTWNKLPMPVELNIWMYRSYRIKSFMQNLTFQTLLQPVRMAHS